MGATLMTLLPETLDGDTHDTAPETLDGDTHDPAPETLDG